MKMNPAIKKLWTDALRSDRFKDRQGKDVLHRRGAMPEDDRFCCLGVLCVLAEEAGVVVKTPAFSHAYLGSNVVIEDIPCWMYRDRNGVVNDSDMSVLPQSVVSWAGLDDVNPLAAVDVEEMQFDDLATLNDSGVTFDRIADLIEESL